MSLWLVRAGKGGQHERKFLENNRVYLTWSELDHDLSRLADKKALRLLLREIYPNASDGKLTNHAAQIWAFTHRIAAGDWIVLPSKHKPAIHVAEATGAYEYDSGAAELYHHHIPVRWIAEDVPRTNFDQDLLYSFGAFLTICQIKRNDAEPRLRAMAEVGWDSTPLETTFGTDSTKGSEVPSEDSASTNLEEVARDQIAKLIIARFKGHGMARLVTAILEAQGYTTHVSPPGPDKGIDILAAPGKMGFGRPRICVQVKSGASPLDRPTLDQLVGTMQNVQADHGLLVSWGGFKKTVDKEMAVQFFRVRLWDQADLIDNLLDHYADLDEDLRAEIPLKRIWTIAQPETNDE